MVEAGEIIHGGNKSWVISHRIGSGKCCEVYRADLQGSEDETVAVKVFRAGSQYEWSCRREQSVLCQVLEDQGTLKQIVCVKDSGKFKGRPYLILEHLSHDLGCVGALWRETGRDSLHICQRLARDALRALSHMHAAGFIHGDVKPSNFMWSSQDDCLKIIDFGLSFHQDDQDVNKVHSPGYQAPEVVTWNSGAPCRRPLTTHCDMWALGCVLLYVYACADRRPDKLSNLSNICKNCSTMDNKEWCEYASLARETIKAGILDQQGKAEFLEFVISLVQCCPGDRPSATEALKMSFCTMTLEPKFHDFLVLKSRILRLLNMLDAEDLRREGDVADVREDVVEECEKFGPVEACIIPSEGPGAEKVFVKFRWSRDADAAFQQLNGRMFSDRTVITTFFCAEDFEKGEFY